MSLVQEAKDIEEGESGDATDMDLQEVKSVPMMNVTLWDIDDESRNDI